MPASGPGGAVRLFTSDAAILEARDTRKDLPCTVTPVKPQLGFDLKFHSGLRSQRSLEGTRGFGKPAHDGLQSDPGEPPR